MNEDTIQQCLEDFSSALIVGDAGSLNGLLHEKFHCTHASGFVENCQHFIARTGRGEVYDRMDFDRVSVSIFAYHPTRANEVDQ